MTAAVQPHSRQAVARAVAFLVVTLTASLAVERFGAAAIPLLGALLAAMWLGTSMASRPELAFMAAIATAPLIAYRQNILGANLTLQRLLLLVGIVLFFANIASGRLQKIVRSPALVFFAAFVLLKAMDLLRTQKVIYSLRQISIILVGMALIWFALQTLRDRSLIKVVLILTVAISPAPVFLGMSQSASAMRGEAPKLPFGDYFNAREDDDPRLKSTVAYSTGDWGSAIRANGTLGGPVAFGEYLAQMAAMVGALLVAGKFRPWGRAALWTYLTVLGTMLVASFSRSAWIIGLVGIGAVFLAHTMDGGSSTIRRSLVTWFTMLLVLATGATIVWMFYPGALAFNFTSLFDPGSERISVHLELRQRAVELWRANPFFGVGLGNYGALSGQGGELSSAHATFVTELAEGGALGVFLLGAACMTVILGLLREVRALDKQDAMYPWALGMLGSTVAVISNNTVLYDTFWRDTTWATFALALTLTDTLRRDRVARTKMAG